MKLYRYVEILRDGEWMRDEFDNIRAGDMFRLYEPDGQLIDTSKAISDARPCEPKGNWIVNSEG